MAIGCLVLAAGCSGEPSQDAEQANVLNDTVPTTAPPVSTASPTVPDPATVVVEADGSEQAAVAAIVYATEFAGTLVYIDQPQLSQQVAEITTDAGFDVISNEVVEELAPMRAALAQLEPAAVWSVNKALSVEVDVQGDTATGQAWVLRVFSRQKAVEPQVEFVTYDIELVLDPTRGWLIDRWAFVPGPAVRLSYTSDPVTAIELDRMLEGHRLYNNRETEL